MGTIEKIEKILDGPVKKFIFITAALVGVYYIKSLAEIFGQVLASAIINWF